MLSLLMSVSYNSGRDNERGAWPSFGHLLCRFLGFSLKTFCYPLVVPVFPFFGIWFFGFFSKNKAC